MLWASEWAVRDMYMYNVGGTLVNSASRTGQNSVEEKRSAPAVRGASRSKTHWRTATKHMTCQIPEEVGSGSR